MTATAVALDTARRGATSQDLGDRLRKLIIGQPQAVDTLVDAYQMYSVGLQTPGRPISTFLFLGPTGTGKTRTVEALAECLTGNPGAVLKIDCAEFQHSHEIAKLVGSPPGYLGHKETHPLLSQETLNSGWTPSCQVSFVLFDEIEKASDSLWNLLLGILDKATLTLGDNKRVDFSRAMIFMTSNLGAKEMERLQRPSLGFAQSGTKGSLVKSAEGQARKKFTPEFMNRLDRMLVFNPLTAENLESILDLELSKVNQRIMGSSANLENPRFKITLDQGARQYILASGTDPRYGARHLKRAIEKSIVQPLANLMASKQIQDGDCIMITSTVDPVGLQFSREPKDS